PHPAELTTDAVAGPSMDAALPTPFARFGRCRSLRRQQNRLEVTQPPDSATMPARDTHARTATSGGTAPARAGLVLISLILVAGVANLNLSVANVALPDIEADFDSSQPTLD